MDGGNGQRPADLSHSRRFRLNPRAYHVFLALRVLEAEARDAPPLGQSRRPRQDALRIGQEPSMSYQPTAVAGFRDRDGTGPARFWTFFFGLFGPHGPLPSHLTEYARERMRTYRDRTFAAFADMLTHRPASLLFRAWVTGQPAASYDKGVGAGFERKVAALGGYLGAGMRDRDAMPDLAKRHFAGHLARGPRNAHGLSAIVSAFFAAPVTVQDFIGSWLRLEPDDLWRLGPADARSGGGLLGRTTSIGSDVWSRSEKFRLRIGPLSLTEYERLLPGGDALARLTAIVRNYAGDRLDWDVNLVLAAADVPPAVLGGRCRLGQTAWVGGRDKDNDAADLFLAPMEHVGANGPKGSDRP